MNVLKLNIIHLLTSIVVLFCLISEVHAGRRVALVIGNSQYENLRPLANPGQDAKAVAEKLKLMGFELIGRQGQIVNKPVLNLSEAQFVKTVRAFSETSNRAEIALVYYAGHGMQFGQDPYLLPVDVPNDDLELVQKNSIRLESMLKKLDGKAALTVTIFDACREIPDLEKTVAEATRNSGFIAPDYRGLAAIRSRGNSRIVAYSGAAGQLVKDGKSNHSPYTSILLELLDTTTISKMSVEGLFMDVAYEFGQRHNGQNPELLLQGVRRNTFYFLEDVELPEKLSFTVKATPYDATVRIVNITPKYRDGIKLEAGSYKVEVSKPGYIREVRDFYLRSGNQLYTVELKRATEPELAPRKSNQPEMVVIPAGSFEMGCVSGIDCSDDEKPVHRVSLKSFKMGKYEVTQSQWEVVMGENPSYFSDCDNCPVEMVNWDDIQQYLKRLNEKTGKSYRLPSEAEWEYAARAGSTGPYSFRGNISTDKANYNNKYTFDGSSQGEYREKTLPVGTFSANAWGLYDVHGNVREWVQDCVNDSYRGAPQDGSAWTRGNCHKRVVRGGSWIDEPYYVRSASRLRYPPSDRRKTNIGFRVLQDP
jgi:formylglycine-generating enzyme required for sulfatase activity